MSIKRELLNGDSSAPTVYESATQNTSSIQEDSIEVFFESDFYEISRFLLIFILFSGVIGWFYILIKDIKVHFLLSALLFICAVLFFGTFYIMGLTAVFPFLSDMGCSYSSGTRECIGGNMIILASFFGAFVSALLPRIYKTMK